MKNLKTYIDEMNSNEDKYLIKTNRLILEVIKQSDINWVFLALSDDDVTKYYGVHFNSVEETREQMDWYDELVSEKKGLWWKLKLQKKEVAAGACGFNNWNHDEKSAEIGFWLLPEWWKKGYMKEALGSILTYGFKVMKLNTIYAEVEEGNEASVRLLESFSFAEEPGKAFVENKNGIQTHVSVFYLEKSVFVDL